MPNTSIDKAEHPDGNGVACGKFHIVFYEVSNLGVFDLFTFFVLSSNLKGNAVNLEIGDLGRCDFMYLRGPGQEVGLTHVAWVDDSVLGKGNGDVAVANTLH